MAIRNRPLDLLCLGEPLYEFNQRPDGLFQGGHGGDTANCAIAAARCGAKSGMLTHLGDDQLGASFLDLWRKEGISTEWVKAVDGEETGVYFVTHNDDGHHFSYRRRKSAASKMGPTDIPTMAIASAKALHVSGISVAISETAADSVFTAIDLAAQHDTLISFDTNLRLALAPLPRSRALFMDIARRCDVLLPGLDDAQKLTGLEHPDAIADYFLLAGCPLIAMTLGAEGALVATDKERFIVPGYPVDAIDATGAGDTFDGAFLSQWIDNGNPAEAARFANAAAALSTTKRGAIEAMPNAAEVNAFLASQSS